MYITHIQLQEKKDLKYNKWSKSNIREFSAYTNIIRKLLEYTMFYIDKWFIATNKSNKIYVQSSQWILKSSVTIFNKSYVNIIHNY